MKNKTLAAYLALFLGLFGAHRFYLKDWRDLWGWLHIVATAIGLVGMRRTWALGQDDPLAWLLMPLLGLSIFSACLAAMIYGLASQARWNGAYNPDAPDNARAGGTSGMTIFAVILALLLGATALMSAIAFAGQRYFEYSLKSV